MIRAYVGRLGSGKTLSMINDSIPSLLKGKKIVTNTPFFIADSHADKKNPNYALTKDGKSGYAPEFIEDATEYIQRFYSESNCLFLIDESAVVMPSKDWNKLPMKVVIKFAQARKYGMDIFYTAQRLNHAVKRLRDLTNEVCKCVKIGPALPFMVIKNSIYDPEFFEGDREFSEKFQKECWIDSKILWPWNLYTLFSYYDTYYKIKFNLITEKDLTTELE